MRARLIALSTFVALLACQSQSSGPSSLSYTAPLTRSEQDDVKNQIEQYRSSATVKACPGTLVEMRIFLDPDGTITRVEAINPLSADPCWLATYEDAKRAAMSASPLKLPSDEYYSTMRLRFHPHPV